MTQRKFWLKINVLVMLLLVVIGVGVVLTYFHVIQKNIAMQETHFISTEAEFLAEMEKGDKAFRGKYQLKKDISVSAAKINALENPVDIVGELNGNLHSITIYQHTASQGLKKPLFRTIQASATVKKLKLIVNTPMDTSSANEIAPLAGANYGKIYDCIVKVGGIEMKGERGAASGLCVYNFGEIHHVYLDVGAVVLKTDVSNADWAWQYGSVAAVNYATVRDVVVSVGFAVKSAGEDVLTENGSNVAVFNRNFDNNHVGYAFGNVGVLSTGTQPVVENIFIVKSDAGNASADMQERLWWLVSDTRYYAAEYQGRLFGEGEIDEVTGRLKTKQDVHVWQQDTWNFPIGQFPTFQRSASAERSAGGE